MTEHNTLFNRKKVSIIAGLLLLVIYSSFALTKELTQIEIEDVKILGGLTIVQFIYTIWSWNYIKKTWFDTYLIFTLVLYAFMLGQPMLETFGVCEGPLKLWDGYELSRISYYLGTYYSMLCVLVFHFGAITSVRPEKNTDGYVHAQNLRPLVIFSIVLLIISAPFYITILLKQITIVQTAGYMAMYSYEDYTDRFSQIMSDFFVPSLVTLFCISMRYKKYVLVTVSLVLAFVFIPPFILGGRSNAVICLAVFMLVYACVYRIKKKQLAIFAGVGFVMLMALTYVGEIRKGTNRSMDDVSEVSDNLEENPAILSIEEMGWSMFHTIFSIEVMPEEMDYGIGRSFFWAGVSMIPNLGFWDGKHPGQLNDPGYKENELANFGYGIGYSMVASTYYEFGYFGVIIMFAYGYFFTRIFSFINRKTLLSKPTKFIFSVLFLWFAIKFVRNSFDSFARSCAMYILPFWLVAHFFVKEKRYRKINVRRLLHPTPEATCDAGDAGDTGHAQTASTADLTHVQS